MLKILRKKGVAKKVLWFLAVIIIIAFGLFGAPQVGRTPFAGKIFGQKINIQDFQNAYQNSVIQARLQYGQNFDNIQQFLNLTSDTWDRLILLHEANKRGIKVSNDEVVDEIQKLPFFQRDNQFDMLLYNDIVKYFFRVKPREFEEAVRDSIKFRKLMDLVTKDIVVTDDEIYKEFEKQNEKIQVSYVLVAPEDFKNEATFNEEQAKKYFQENQPQFLSPPSINAEFISLSLPEGDDETAKKTIRDQAQLIFEELLANPNMTEVAKKFNVTVQETGFISQEKATSDIQIPFSLLSQLFQQPTGQISAPFETADATFISKVKETKESYLPQYDEVKDAVKEAVLNKNARETAKTKAEEYLASIKGEIEKTMPHDFTKTAKTLGFDIRQTPAFIKGQYLPEIGIAKDFQDVAFALSESNKISGVVETEKGFTILHLDERVPAQKEDFDQKKNELKGSMLQEKKSNAFNIFITNLRLNAKIVDNISNQNQAS